MKVMWQKRMTSLPWHFGKLPFGSSIKLFYDIWMTNLQYSLTSPILCIRVYWQLWLDDMLCKVNSPWTDFVCLFPSVLLLFKEVFGAFSVEKGEKYHIMECYLVWKPANRLPFRRQEKGKKKSIVSMLLSVLKINLAPFLQEEALNDNVMRKYILINFGY